MKFKNVELLAANLRITDSDKRLIRSENVKKFSAFVTLVV
jgi:hypothetical protein